MPSERGRDSPADDADVLLRLRDVAWLPVPNVVESVAGPLPAGVQATSAVVLVVDDQDHVVLTRVAARGWDVPGGHVESGETARDAAARELSEETGLAVAPTALQPAGHVRLQVLAARPAGYRYPYPDSCMAAWSASTGRLRPSLRPAAGSECTDAAWFPLQVAREHLDGGSWWPLLQRHLDSR